MAENELGIAGRHALILHHGGCGMPKVVHSDNTNAMDRTLTLKLVIETARVDGPAGGRGKDELVVIGRTIRGFTEGRPELCLLLTMR